MISNKLGRWQFSLATLMIFVALAAVVCAMAGYVGYAFILGIAPIIWVFWVTERLIRSLSQSDNRNDVAKRGPDPIFKNR